MEASGHQKIEIETWLKPLAEKLGVEWEKGNFRSDALGFDAHVGAIYLGNWISDMSQFVNEDLVNALEISKEIIENIKQLLEDLIKYIKTKAKDIIKKGESVFLFFEEQISYYWEGEHFSHDIIWEATNKIIEEINCLICALDRIQLESVINSVYVVKLTTKKKDERRELIRQGIRLVVQLLGYTKFCYQKNSEIYIDKSIYNEIFPKLITSYYPFDHIDRTVDLSIGRVPNPIPCDFDPKNFYDRRFPYQNDYKTLTYIQESINLASKRISVFEEQIAIPIINNIKPSISQSQWHYHLAQLGKGLHIVEDYFAHSTFMANAVIGLMEKDKENKNGATHLDNLLLNKYERNKLTMSLIDIDSKFQENDKNIFTGFFEKNDMAASFFHLIAGFLQEKLDLPSESYSDVIDKYADGIFRDVPFINVIDDIFDKAIEKVEKKVEEITKPFIEIVKPEEIKLVSFDRFYFNTLEVKDILGRYESLEKYGKDKFVTTKLRETINIFLKAVYISRGGLDNIENILNLLKALKGFKDIYKVIVKVIQFVKIIKKISLILRLVKKNANLPKIALQLAIDIIKVEAFYYFYVLIERDIIKSNRIGSHALIAIDEELAKPNLYGATERTAEFINKCIFKNIFKEPRQRDEENNIQLINWDVFLNKSLKHPYFYLNLDKFRYDPFEEVVHKLKKGETIATILAQYAGTVHPDFRDRFKPAFLGANPSTNYLSHYSAIDILLDPLSKKFRVPYQLGNPIFINLKAVKVESDVEPWFEKTINDEEPVSNLEPFIELFNNETLATYKRKSIDEVEAKMKKEFDDFEKNRIKSSNDCIKQNIKSMMQDAIDFWNKNVDNSCAACEKKNKSQS